MRATAFKRFSKDDSSRNCIQYEGFREYCLRRDGHMCIDCFSDEDLDVHHIKDWDNFPDLRYTPSNGLTLCRSCHMREEHRVIGEGFVGIPFCPPTDFNDHVAYVENMFSWKEKQVKIPVNQDTRVKISERGKQRWAEVSAEERRVHTTPATEAANLLTHEERVEAGKKSWITRRLNKLNHS